MSDRCRGCNCTAPKCREYQEGGAIACCPDCEHDAPSCVSCDAAEARALSAERERDEARRLAEEARDEWREERRDRNAWIAAFIEERDRAVAAEFAVRRAMTVGLACVEEAREGERRARERIAAALLGVYAFRADRDEEHNLAVGTFMLAVAQRLLPEEQRERIDAARCALWLAAHSQPVPDDYRADLVAIDPALAKLRVCPDCGIWRAHTIACPTLKAADAAFAALDESRGGRG